MNMNDLVSWKQLIESQDDLRKRIIRARRSQPRSWKDVALEIGISVNTLKKFIKENIDVEFAVLTKLNNWVRREEL